jgi:signal transduction histidine kinase
MDARTRERALVENFFTTKEGGSGLGLWFARRAMDAHRGDIEIESAEGHGTRITMRFPAAIVE